MSPKPKPTVHDKQIETWSRALQCAMEFVGEHAKAGSEKAKTVQMKVIEILYENEDEA